MDALDVNRLKIVLAAVFLLHSMIYYLLCLCILLCLINMEIVFEVLVFIIIYLRLAICLFQCMTFFCSSLVKQLNLVNLLHWLSILYY